MNEIKKLWDKVKSMLHYGPSTQPLWQAIIDKLHEFEARIAALEGHPAMSIPPLGAGAAISETPVAPAAEAPVEQLKPEVVAPVDPQQPAPDATPASPDIAATSATDSSAAGDKANPDSPVALPDQDGAGQSITAVQGDTNG